MLLTRLPVLLGSSSGTLERQYSRIMLSPPQNMKPYLGHYARIIRAYSLLRVLLCFLIAEVRHHVAQLLGRGGDDAVGTPRRAQISQFELFERIVLLKIDKRFSVEQFEATVSQSTTPSPLPSSAALMKPLPSRSKTLKDFISIC